MARTQRRFNLPTRPIWIIGVILGLLSILLHYHVIHISALARYDFLLMVLACVLLAVAAVARGF
jgi:hypothetical protein